MRRNYNGLLFYKQRYPTGGDWQIDKAGDLHIAVSKMSDQRHDFLIGMHEAIEPTSRFTPACHLRLSTGSTGHTKPSESPVTTASRAMTLAPLTTSNMCSPRRSSDCWRRNWV